MNEKDVKSGKKRAVCSVTGCDCKCGSGGGCVERSGNGTLDPLPNEAVRWAKAAILSFRHAERHLDLALSECPRSRTAPEFREAQRLIVCAIKVIEERL